MVITSYSQKTGLYLVAESIDCGGKGSIISAIKKKSIGSGKLVLDLRLLWPSDEEGKIPPGHDNPLYALYETDNVIPEYEKLKEYYLKMTGRRIDTIFTCEPTWANYGLLIRKKAVHEVLGKNYTAEDTAKLYAPDRHELISKLILPAVLDGVDVYCERNFCSSIVYQSSMDDVLTVEQILALEGNAYATRNSPHLYIICDVSAETAMERKAIRKKQDACKFEVLPFQKRIAEKYKSLWLRELLNSHGSIVAYVNTEKPTTPEDTVSAALSVVELFKSGKLQNSHKVNYDIK
jgi:thymidylate kinase